jgi:hypothetical protein
LTHNREPCLFSNDYLSRDIHLILLWIKAGLVGKCAKETYLCGRFAKMQLLLGGKMFSVNIVNNETTSDYNAKFEKNDSVQFKFVFEKTNDQTKITGFAFE